MSELLYTVGRVLIPIVFIVSGIEHCISVQSFAETLAAANLPFPPQVDQYVPLPKYQSLGYLLAAIEVVAGVLIAIGFLTRLAAFVLFVFCGATIFFLQHFWNMDGAARAANQIAALTNLALMGAMLLLMVRGAGGYSLDGRGEHAGDKARTGAPAAQAA